MENKKLKVGVLGLGLIGGSILKALFKTGKYHLTAVSNSSYKEAEAFSEVSGCDINLLKNAEVIFVCSKMSETAKKLNLLNDVAGKETIVSDVCSIKGFLPSDFKFNFISSHPMAGIEKSGFSASFDNLFTGAKWIIEKENEILENIIKDTGAKPLVMPNDIQDKLTASISHLPTILSFALFNSADDSAKKIASSGFRDMTRLALSDSDLAYDMLHLNKKNLEAAYKKLIESFEEIKKMSEEDFKKFAHEIAGKRAQMYDKNGKNVF